MKAPDLRIAAILVLFTAICSITPGVRTPAYAGDEPFWPADRIPSELREGAVAILREEQLRFRVEEADRATLTVRRIITILSAEGQQHGWAVVFYDSFRKVGKIEGGLYNARGALVRRLDSKDIVDRSAVSETNLADDSRARIAGLIHTSFPYTVVLEYQLEYRGLMNWPEWSPSEPGVAVERSIFSVSAPDDLPFRYKAINVDSDPVDTSEKGRRTVKWSVGNIPARNDRRLAAGFRGMPRILTAPESFRLGKHSGSLATWEDFGRWHFDLWKDRKQLPPETVQRLRRLTEGVPDTTEKVRKLYDDLQESTRYVSIQYGIGGWQPVTAESVVRTGYADCKGLVNLMAASLEAIGLTSYPALARGGVNVPDVIAEFPSNQFNHVILCVPLAADTLWVECTNGESPLGWLGPFMEDRNVLLLSPTGGLLRRTPAIPAEKNRLERVTHARISESGTAAIDVSCVGMGVHRDRLISGLGRGPGEESNRWLLREMNQAQLRILTSDLTGIVEDADQVRFALTGEITALGSRTGHRMFLKPFLPDRWTAAFSVDEGSDEPLSFLSTTASTDTIQLEIPKGFIPESIPTGERIDVPFASYELAVQVDGSHVRLIRNLVIRRKEVPAEAFDDLRRFTSTVIRNDNAEMVFVTAE